MDQCTQPDAVWYVMEKLEQYFFEHKTAPRQLFNQFDRNHDHELSREEFLAGFQSRAREMFTDEEVNLLFNHLDDNGNDRLTFSELLNAVRAHRDANPQRPDLTQSKTTPETVPSVFNTLADQIAVCCVNEKEGKEKNLNGSVENDRIITTIADIPQEELRILIEENKNFDDRVQRTAAIQNIMATMSPAFCSLKVLDISSAPQGTRVMSFDEFQDSLLARSEGSSAEAVRYAGLQHVAVNLVEYFYPKMDRDFTNISDDNTTFIRGGEDYKRPCGWKRYALNVSKKYADNKWLGSTGAKGVEWPVSYHGTKKEFVENIVKTEYKTGHRAMYGRGVYSTPLLSIAEQYSSRYEEGGEEYKLVMQNRINPERREIVNNGDYWLIPEMDEPDGNLNNMSECIRPYGILVQKL